MHIFTSMNTNNYLAAWSEKLLSAGRYSFSLGELRSNQKDLSDEAVKSALRRLSEKKKIASVFNGYYIIIPPQYALRGILPAPLFLDALMKHLNRPYYVSLLSAAALHGAAHQQPQEYFVTTSFPQLRPIKKGGLKINFISVKTIPAELIQKQKTEAGYLNFSNAALTACDLIQYQKRIGGINRAAAVIDELCEVITPEDFSPALINHCKNSTLQRLGFLLEIICNKQELADALYDALKKEVNALFRIPLKPGRVVKGGVEENRWKVAMNTEIDIEQ